MDEIHLASIKTHFKNIYEKTDNCYCDNGSS